MMLTKDGGVMKKDIKVTLRKVFQTHDGQPGALEASWDPEGDRLYFFMYGLTVPQTPWNGEYGSALTIYDFDMLAEISKELRNHVDAVRDAYYEEHGDGREDL